MKFLSVVVLTAIVSAVAAGGKKFGQLKEEIATLESSFSEVLDGMEATIENITARLDAMEAERVQLDRDHAWQALHMAAAAACRGSTPSGGTGPWGNAVLPKENTRSCADVCGDTMFNLCDADVSVSGYTGKAESYEEPVGQFYNYGCAKPGNTNKKFDEVKAEEGDVFNDKSTGNVYFRFCCCRKE